MILGIDLAQWQWAAGIATAIFALIAAAGAWRAVHYLKRQEQRQQAAMEMGLDLTLQPLDAGWNTAVWSFENRGPHLLRVRRITLRQPRGAQLAPGAETGEGTFVPDEKGLGRTLNPELTVPPGETVRYRCFVHSERGKAKGQATLVVAYEERGPRLRQVQRRIRRPLNEA
jgi:hypothetical protein